METDPDSLTIYNISPELREVVVSKLTEALLDADPEVRRIAVLNLGRVGDQAFGAVPAIVQMLNQDPSFELRPLAAAVLAGLGARTLPFLLNALASSSPETRNAARQVLDQHPLPKRDWMPGLIQVANDQDPLYRYHAIQVLFAALDRRIDDRYVFLHETTFDLARETFHHSLADSDEGVSLLSAYALWIVYRDTSGVELITAVSRRPDDSWYDLSLKMIHAIELGMENE